MSLSATNPERKWKWLVHRAGSFAMTSQTTRLICKTYQKNHNQPDSFSGGWGAVPGSMAEGGMVWLSLVNGDFVTIWVQDPKLPCTQERNSPSKAVVPMQSKKALLGKYSSETYICICALYKHNYYFRRASSQGRFVLHFSPSRPPKQLPGLLCFFGPVTCSSAHIVADQ